MGTNKLASARTLPWPDYSGRMWRNENVPQDSRTNQPVMASQAAASLVRTWGLAHLLEWPPWESDLMGGRPCMSLLRAPEPHTHPPRGWGCSSPSGEPSPGSPHAPHRPRGHIASCSSARLVVSFYILFFSFCFFFLKQYVPGMNTTLSLAEKKECGGEMWEQ